MRNLQTENMSNKIDEVLLSAPFLRQRNYWSKKLLAGGERTQFPFKTGFKGSREAKIEKIEIPVSRRLFEQLTKLGKNSDLSLYIILLTALQLLIYRYTTQEDLVVISPLYKKNITPETLNRQVYIRGVIHREASFIQQLLQTRASVLEAYENQDYPSDKLTVHLFPAHTPGTGSLNPLSDVVCLLENIHQGISAEEPGEAVVFSFLRKKNSLSAHILFSGDMYERGYFESTVRQFKGILEWCMGNVKTAIVGIISIPGEEERRLVEELNRTRADYPLEKTLADIFREQAERTPDRVALVGPELQMKHFKQNRSGNISLTYQELKERTDRLAALLIETGLRADSIAAIMLERSLEMMIGLLGILTAGAAYMPIEPGYPEERILYMLNDSSAKFLLTSPGLSEGLSGKLKKMSIKNCRLILVNEMFVNETSPGRQRLHQKLRGNYQLYRSDRPNLAYIIYTSGTSGKPRGVMIDHQSIINYIWWAARTYVKKPGVRFPFFTSISFDLTLTSQFTPLLTGGTVVIYGEEEQPLLVERIIREDQCDIVKLTPSHLALIKYQDIDASTSHIKSFIVGGENLTGDLCLGIHQTFKGNIEIYNEYGPTEAAVGCMIYTFAPDYDHGKSVPIGKPISNTKIYVLDRNLKTVTYGVPGELFIGGAGVGRGYLNNPELTAKQFVREAGPVFRPGTKKDRIYRTGDLARWLLNDNIEFLGRKDTQIKVRGYRIELGEIESRLLKYGGIKKALVIVREGELSAYVVPGKQLDLPGLRYYLSKSLPEYMIPLYFVQLKDIPLTVSGKVDLEALPRPQLSIGESCTAPRNTRERRMAEIWAAVLGIKKSHIGIDDNFFEMGGNSLKATILMAKIHKVLQIKIPLEELFKNPTIRGLTGILPGKKEVRFSYIQLAEEKEFYILSSAQKRLYVLRQMDSTGSSYNVTQGVVLEGLSDVKKLETVFFRLIKRHENLRTSFEMINDMPVQRIHREVDFGIEYVAGSQPGGSPRELVNAFIRPFDLSQAPLLRVGLIKEKRESHILVVDMHHIITDGVSMDLFIREFRTLYSGLEPGPLKVRYRDYSQWQNSARQREILKEQDQYWLKQFAGEIPVLDLPLDYPRPVVRRFEGAAISFRLSRQQSRMLNELALAEGVTLYMVLFAIFNVFLSRLSGQDDIVVGTSIAARRHADLENIIGMFVNNLPIRNYPGANKTFHDFLMEVKNNTLEAFENQDYPFEELVERVPVRRDTGRNPLFDVLFALQNTALHPQDSKSDLIPGLRIKPFNTEVKTAKFDLHLVCIEKKENISGMFEYCTGLFKKETIEQFIHYYKKTVSDITRTPGIEISQVEIITEEEKKQILYKRDLPGFESQKERILLSSKFMKQRAYWLKKMSPGLEKTELPIITGSKQNTKTEIEKIDIPIPGELFNRLMNLGKQSDISLYIILLSSLKLLIYRYTGSEDVIVVSPVYLQNVDAETLNDGVFIRDRLDEKAIFIELLLQVRVSVLEAYENQDYPSDKLVEYLSNSADAAGGGNPGSLPLSDIVCLLSNIHNSKMLETRGDSNQLFFSFNRENDCLSGHILYSKGMYERDYLQLVADHFIKILENIGRDVKTKISTLVFSSWEQDKKYIVDFNQTRASYPEEKTLIELFAEQVERTPDHVAVEYKNQAITYNKLNEKANRLAWCLRRKDVRAERIVGICMERSSEMIIAVLAVLKTGGAFLPIDDQYPEIRKQFIQEDSQLKVLLTQKHILHRDIKNIRPPSGIEFLCVDVDDKDNYSNDTANLPVIHSPMNLAYVIYTSGTSGTPRGVMINHRSIVNYTWWAAREYIKNYIKNKVKRFPLFTSISFDLTMSSIFVPLVSGNTIVVYGEEEQALLVRQVIAENKVEAVKLTPSHLALIKHQDEESSSANIQCFIVGGEKLERDLALYIYNKFNGNIDIYNEYGPTETAVGCMIYCFNPGYAYGKSVPIGKPIDNTKIYILDKHLNPVTYGVPGELFICGAGLGRGYLNNPELTSEKFIRAIGPDPNQKKLPRHRRQKIYRTGDLARRLLDGNIEFLGRKDTQVKVRGYRIEPGEIESQLLKYGGILEAVVISRADELCAYVVPGKSLDINGLRDYLSKFLPEYMIPLYVVPLKHIPLTVSGKVDVKALPVPHWSKSENHKAPRNPWERRMAEVWSSVLGIEKGHIDIDANFFEMGGNSLRATILISKLHKTLGVKIPLAELFKTFTIRELAAYVKEPAPASERFTALEAVEDREYYTLSPAQKRMYLLQQVNLESTVYNLPLLFTLPAALESEPARLEKYFLELINRHESLRTYFTVVNDNPVQRIREQVEFAVQTVTFASESSRRIAINQFIHSFDLSRAPLLRVVLLKVEQEKSVIFIDMHHIISDGLSHDILESDFTSLLNQEDLPPLKLQYKDFSGWHNSEMAKEAMKRQEQYWINQFKDRIPVLNLSTDFKRHTRQHFEGQVISFEINEEKTQQIKTLAKEENLTVFIVLFAIFNVLLSKLTLQEDLIIGTDAAGRRHADLDRIVGMFVNTLAIRSYPGSEQGFKEYLIRLKDTILRAFENQDYPFEDVVDRVVDKRDPGRNPLFDVMFSFLEISPGEITAAGKDSAGPPQRKYSYEHKTAKFDLVLVIVDSRTKLAGSFEYSTLLFKKERIKKYVTFFEEILSAVLANSTVKLKDIPITSELLEAKADHISMDFGF